MFELLEADATSAMYRGQLRAAQVEAKQAKEHAEQYHSISSATEEALADLTATYDQYKASTESSLASKDVSIPKYRRDFGLMALV